MTEQLPLVAVLSRVPNLSQGIAAALVELAEVRIFQADGDTPGLLRSLRPDAIVVDDADQAEQAVLFARDEGATLLHISLHDRRLRIYGRGGWRESADEGASPEAIRNAIAGALYGRGER